MPAVFGIGLGTTKITALALDTASGAALGAALVAAAGIGLFPGLAAAGRHVLPQDTSGLPWPLKASTLQTS